MNISEDKERQDLLRSALFNGNKNVTLNFLIVTPLKVKRNRS